MGALAAERAGVMPLDRAEIMHSRNRTFARRSLPMGSGIMGVFKNDGLKLSGLDILREMNLSPMRLRHCSRIPICNV
jgi:hypothetical protein